MATRFELVNEGFADLCLTTWPRHHVERGIPPVFGAADEARTRYLHLGKVALYQMSYGRIPTHLTLRPPCMGASFTEVGFVGDPDRARTDDPQRDRLVL